MDQKETREEQKSMKTEMLLMLNIGSMILVLGSVFMIQLFGVLYGVASGALIQSIASNTPLSQSIQSTALQVATFHTDLIESYIMVFIALILFSSAFLMFIRRVERGTSTIRKYSMMHGAFSVIYLLLFFVVFAQFTSDFSFIYIDGIYFGMALCLIVDGYLNYIIRMQETKKTKTKNVIGLEPGKPFTNILNIQEQLFSNLSGSLKIIDKNFNSNALATFHRLIDGAKGISGITILTSIDLMDSSFQSNVNDFRKELQSKGISLDVRLMDDSDRIEQHERMIFDDKMAYKIPPFNIINKRSEHITRINLEEARKRFSYLYARARTLENQAIKNARKDETKPDMPPQ